MVSSTPSLDGEKSTGFRVLWFCGFMISSTPSLDGEKPIGFMVSWFHVFVVSWFHPIHLWDIEKTSGCMVSWFHGFIRSISLTKEDAGFEIQWTSVVDKA